MLELAERLGKTIRKQEFLRAGERVAIAVSGGADSVALLLLLAELRHELGIVLSVAHVNHKLRGAESDADEDFVAALAAAQRLEFAKCTAPVEREQGAGIESTARRLRYEFFRELARDRGIDKVATAHTLDDQAETVLLRIFRGTGIRGLAGILPRLRLENERKLCGEVVRPLLGYRRAELRQYLVASDQAWREDSSNEDVVFLRNRVRRQLMPIIEDELGAAAIEHMADLAEIARAEEERWRASGSDWKGGIDVGHAVLDLDQLFALPLAALRRIVRAWIEANAPGVSISFRLIEQVLELARGAAGKTLELTSHAARGSTGIANPGLAVKKQRSTAKVRRTRKELVLESVTDIDAGDYEYVLTIPGEVYIPELKLHLVAQMVDVRNLAEEDREAVVDPTRLGQQVLIRNWRAGDRFWPAHTKAPKKVKELLSDRHLAGAQKKLWPVAVSGDEIVWIRGYAASDRWQGPGQQGILIREA